MRTVAAAQPATGQLAPTDNTRARLERAWLHALRRLHPEYQWSITPHNKASFGKRNRAA